MSLFSPYNINRFQFISLETVLLLHWDWQSPTKLKSKNKKINNSRYDYEECELEPCNAMMTAMETFITSSSFTGRSFSFGGKTYKVKIADNFSYNDPIDKSISTKQV